MGDRCGRGKGCRFIGCDGLRCGIRRGYNFACSIENFPCHPDIRGVGCGVPDYRAEIDRCLVSINHGANIAFILSNMHGVGFGEPDVSIDTRALIEPAIAKAGIDSCYDAVLGAYGDEVGEIEMEWRIAIVVAADETAIDPDQDVAKGSIEVNADASAGVAGGNIEG